MDSNNEKKSRRLSNSKMLLTWESKKKKKLQQKKKNIKESSPSGNQTPVSRVTGGDTYHYTNEEMYAVRYQLFI